MSDHTCGQCCQALSYVDSILRVDIEQGRGLSRRWRLLHPWQWRDAKVRRDYALDILHESGK
jgi:hypothetical protein